MQENKEKGIEDLYEDAKKYVDTRAEYIRLYLVEKISKVLRKFEQTGEVRYDIKNYKVLVYKD